MMNFFIKIPKHTNASTFDIFFRIFFLNVTCLEVLLPPPPPPQNTYNIVFSNKKAKMGGAFGFVPKS
jgi:hypothetical protein